MKTIKIGRYFVPLWLVVVLLVSGVGSGAFAYYLWTKLTIPIEVKEPLEVLDYPTKLSLFPGETEEFNITVTNHASVNYSVTLDFTLNNTAYQENYVTFSGRAYTLVPGQQDLTATLTVDPGAPSVSVSLTIELRRIGEVVFFDDFDGATLKSEWQTVDLYGGSTFSLTSRSGYLRILTTSPPDRDLYGVVNFYSPRIWQTVYGNITVETELLATTETDVQSAGIVVWKDQNNFLRLERACRGGYQEILFVGTINGVWSMPSPEVSDPGAVLHTANINPTHLRLTRTSTTYSGYYSSDGVNWNFVANITMETDYSLMTGLYVVNRGPQEFSSTAFFADFDYFRVVNRK